MQKMRVRLVYSKRGLACFVPHIALAQMFARSVIRAGLLPEYTQGFSPHAKISFAPELPAGVVALNEPVDLWLNDAPKNIIDIMNNSLPSGFNISRVILPDDNSPSLGKLCRYAEYLVRCNINICEHAKNFYHDNIIHMSYINDYAKIIISDPAQNPIGPFVRRLTSEKLIAGWPEINIVRTAIGSYYPEIESVKI